MRQWLIKVLLALLRALGWKPPVQLAMVIITFSNPRRKAKGLSTTKGGSSMAQELSDLDEIDAQFTFLKPDGTDGTIDQSSFPATITSSDPTAATATLAPDALSAAVRSGDNLPASAPVTFEVEVDADMGAGVDRKKFTFDMTILSHTAGEVASMGVSFGTPRRKSPTP